MQRDFHHGLLKVPTSRVTEILNGQRAITGDTALRLAHFFGTSAEFWLNLQSLHELRVAEARPGKAVEKVRISVVQGCEQVAVELSALYSTRSGGPAPRCACHTASTRTSVARAT